MGGLTNASNSFTEFSSPAAGGKLMKVPNHALQIAQGVPKNEPPKTEMRKFPNANFFHWKSQTIVTTDHLGIVDDSQVCPVVLAITKPKRGSVMELLAEVERIEAHSVESAKIGCKWVIVGLSGGPSANDDWVAGAELNTAVAGAFGDTFEVLHLPEPEEVAPILDDVDVGHFTFAILSKSKEIIWQTTDVNIAAVAAETHVYSTAEKKLPSSMAIPVPDKVELQKRPKVVVQKRASHAKHPKPSTSSADMGGMSLRNGAIASNRRRVEKANHLTIEADMEIVSEEGTLDDPNVHVGPPSPNHMEAAEESFATADVGGKSPPCLSSVPNIVTTIYLWKKRFGSDPTRKQVCATSTCVSEKTLNNKLPGLGPGPKGQGLLENYQNKTNLVLSAKGSELAESVKDKAKLLTQSEIHSKVKGGLKSASAKAVYEALENGAAMAETDIKSALDLTEEDFSTAAKELNSKHLLATEPATRHGQLWCLVDLVYPYGIPALRSATRNG